MLAIRRHIRQNLPAPLSVCDIIAKYAVESPQINRNHRGTYYAYRGSHWIHSVFYGGEYRTTVCALMHGRNVRFVAYRYLIVTYDIDEQQVLSVTATPEKLWDIHTNKGKVAAVCVDRVHVYHVDECFDFRLVNREYVQKLIVGIYDNNYVIKHPGCLTLVKFGTAKHGIQRPVIQCGFAAEVQRVEIQKNIITYVTHLNVQSDLLKF
jgi:hypothetical protein